MVCLDKACQTTKFIWKGLTVIAVPYFDICLTVCVNSQAEDLDSIDFFLPLYNICCLFAEPRALDHLVRVTRSSTCASLISKLEKQPSSSLICCTDSEQENEDLMLGEEDLLISGPVCVTTSFLTITGALLVPKCFMLSIHASAQAENNISKG